ncbi:MAG: DNA methylase N-4 [Lachnospiraceae bacterium]|nr:DNA methylase N-4 [Lachnospiraceae bacterium]
MEKQSRYMEFLRSKMAIAKQTGFEIDKEQLNAKLLPHQKDIVQWVVRGGRRAVFAQFGLGKTVIQLEFCRKVIDHNGGKALIICPLGVKQEFAHDAVEILGYTAPVYVKTMQEVKDCNADIMITNYERVRDGDIDVTYFAATSLDEAAVLRSFGSKTYQEFLQKFRGVPYKMVATATPDPNKYKELIHYAGYLEIMDTGQALTRFFQRDSTKANNLTLYPHKEQEFWLWVSSWAVFVGKPSDVNPDYSDKGYDLPPFEIRYHKLETIRDEFQEERDGQLKLFEIAAADLQSESRIKRESIKQRVAKAKEIIDENPDEHYLIWHDLEEERHEIKRQIDGVTEIYGSQDIETREQRTIDFSEGRIKRFATKKILSGSGCNFQKHCHRAIFLGIDYKFNDFIQAIHRIYRFLQTEQVIIDVIYMDEEAEILTALKEKWKRFDYQSAKMAEIVRDNGLSTVDSISDKMKRSIGVDRVVVEGKHFKYINNDCILELEQMEENSVDEIITSIPFGNHYEYTPSYNDLGHNEDNDRFFEQMDYLTPNLLKVLKPGRVACIHVKDRILFGNATGDGMPTVDPFSDLTVMHYMKHGFRYMGRITITTDVVRENNQTYRLGWTEQCKDGSKMGIGCPEYVLLFRKLPTDTSRAYADTPVTKSKEEYTRGRWQIDAHAYWRSSGNRLVTKDELMNTPTNKLQKIYTQYSRTHVYSYEEHVALAEKLDKENRLPATFMVVAPASWNDTVWDDINRMRTLNSEQKRRDLQMHVCPLQLDIVERLIDRYSNVGDRILDPFGGIGTVPMLSIKKGRYGIATELNTDYFRDGVGYCKAAEDELDQPTLFDLIDDAV